MDGIPAALATRPLSNHCQHEMPRAGNPSSEILQACAAGMTGIAVRSIRPDEISSMIRSM